LRALRAIDAGKYHEVVPLLVSARSERVRRALLQRAEGSRTLEPNLAQALAIIGGTRERVLLRRHLRALRRTALARLSEEDQLAIVHIADSLLCIQTSTASAKLLVTALYEGYQRTKEVAARIISDRVMARCSLPVQRILLGALGYLSASDDTCFAAALPVLLQRDWKRTRARCEKILDNGAADPRRRVVIGLIRGSYESLSLLLYAFHAEPDLRIRLLIARTLAPAISARELSRLVREALHDPSPASRRVAAQLLAHASPRLARQLAHQRDPDHAVDAVLATYRSAAASETMVPTRSAMRHKATRGRQ